MTGAGNSLTITNTLASSMGSISGVLNFLNNGGGGMTVSGTLTTTGTQTWNNALTLGGTTTLSGTTVTLGSTVTAAGNSLTITNTAASSLTLGSITGVLNFLNNGGGGMTVSGTLTTTGTQTWNNALTLGGATVLSGTTISLGSTVTAAGNSLTITNTAASSLTLGNIGGVLNFLNNGGGGMTVSGTLTTTGTQTWNNALTLGGATVLSGTTVSLGSTVTGAGNSLTITNTAASSLTLGSITGVLNFLNNGGGGMTVSGTLTTTGTQTWSNALTLGGATVLSGTTISLGSTVTAAGNSLTITNTAASSLTLGNIGGVLNFLNNGGGGMTVSGTLTTTGTQTWNNALTLGGDHALSGTTVTLGSTVTGAGNSLTITNTLASSMGSISGVLNFLNNGGGGMTVSGTLTTTGTQTWNNALTLGGTTTLSGTTVTLGSTVTGAGNSLTITNTAASSLTLGNITGVLNFLNNGGGGMTVSGTLTTTGTQTWNNALTLGGATVLSGTTISLGSTVTAAGNSLTITNTAASSLTLGNIGGVLNFLNNGGGGMTVSGTLTTTGTQTWNNALTLGGATVLSGTTVSLGSTVTGAGNSLTITNTAASSLTLGSITGVLNFLNNGGGGMTVSGTLTTTGTQTWNNALTLGGAIVLSGTTVSLGSTLAGATNDLTITNSAASSLTLGNITGVANFTNNGGGGMTVSGILTTSASQTWSNALTLAGTTTLSGTTISLGSTVTGAGNSLTITNTAVSSLTPGSITGVLNFLNNGGGAMTISGTLTTTGTQTWNNPLTLGGVTVLSGTTISLGSTVTGAGNNLTITNTLASSLTLGNIAGVLNFTNNGGGGMTVTGNLTTTGTQAWDNPLTLASAVTLSGTTMSFASTVGNTTSQTLTISGNASFGGIVGGGTGLASLSVSGTTAINTTAVTTTGGQTYSSAVTLGAGATLTDTTVSFGTTVVGAGNSLTLASSGAIILALGNITGVLNFTNSNGGSASVSGTLTTTGTQTWNNPLTLGGATVLSGTTISLGSTVTGAGNNLTITNTLASSLTLGNIAGVLNFTNNGGGGMTVTGNLTTTGTQAWDNPLTLASAVTLSGTTMSFASTVGNTTSQTLTISGNASFGGIVGGGTGLASLSVSGTTAINTTAVTTTGGQTYSSAVTLGAAAVLTTGGGNILFSSTITGAANNLTLVSHAGTTTVSGTLSGVGTLTLQDNTAASTGTMTFNGGVTATLVTTFGQPYAIAFNAGGTLTSLSTFSNKGTFTIGASGFVFTGGAIATAPSTVVFAGVVSAAGTGVLNFGAAAVSVAGTATLGGASTGQITVGAASIAAGATLTLGAGGATPIATGAIAGSAPSANLTINTTLTATVGGAIGLNIATVTITAGTLDVQGNNFTIGTLTNSGVFRLTGSQATQSIGSMTMSGKVQYYGAGGTLYLSVFNNLEIAGTGTFTLGQPIQVGPALVGTSQLLITSGTLDVSPSSFQITVNGNWNNTVGTAGFTARIGTVSFVEPAPGPILVSGSTSWYIFDCQVSGTTIIFQSNQTQTILNAVGATFRVKTGAGNINLTSDNPAPAPPSAPGGYWFFTLNPLAALDMNNVTVDASTAAPYSVPVPAGVTITAPGNVRCPGWQNINAIIASATLDLTHNGKIDRILVTAQFNLTRTAAAFSGLSITVTGYALNTSAGSAAGSPYNWSDPYFVTHQNQFWIMLNEQPYLDSGATPVWTITKDTTLYDSSIGIYVVPTGSHTPADTSPPVIAYTLAEIGNNQVFVRFSENVLDTSGGALVAADFSFTTGALPAMSVNAVGSVGPGQIVLTVNRNITPEDLLLPVTLTVAGTAKDSSGNTILPVPVVAPPAPETHRISDLGLGQLTDSLFEPVWAHDETVSGTSATGIGLIQLGGFDGSKWLRARQNLAIEGHIHTTTTAIYPGPTLYPASGATSLWYDTNVASSLRAGAGLWLPPFTDDVTLGGFSGLVPTGAGGDSSAASVPESSAPSPQLRDFKIPGSDSRLTDNSVLDFFFQIPTVAGSSLFAARVVNPAAIDWYNHVAPWTFDLHDIRTQRGGATILNNVIHPDKGELATLQYTQPSAGPVTIMVFDLSGSIVNVLTRVSSQAAGDYAVSWDGKNRGGRAVARGIYFIRIVAPGIDETRKVLVVR